MNLNTLTKTVVLLIAAMLGACGSSDQQTTDLTCQEASCDPLASCDDSSGNAVCECPQGYDDPQNDGSQCVKQDVQTAQLRVSSVTPLLEDNTITIQVYQFQYTRARATSKNLVTVSFSQAVDPATAKEITNYHIEGLSISEVSVSHRSVTLTTSDQTPGARYTVTTENIQRLD